VRIQLPTRISLAKTVLFGAVFFCVQQAEHTDLIFSVLFFGYLVLSIIAFNIGGGFSRASGAYVFLFMTLTVGIGVLWKAILGEPADTNLLAPQFDMACYTASMFCLLLVIVTNRKLIGSSQGIAPGEPNYTLSALGCLVVGILQTILNNYATGGAGSFVSAFNQLSQFYPLAIILGTIGAIRDSGGRRSINFVSGLAMALVFASGTLVFSKQGMLMSGACWVVAAAYTRYKLRTINLIALALFGYFAIAISSVLATGRQYVSEGTGVLDRAAIAYRIVTHLQEYKEIERQSAEHVLETEGRSGYYNEHQGFIERLSMLSVDDTFFNYASKGKNIGLKPVLDNYENLIPHVIDPDKPVPIGGNYYAHQIGGFLAGNDDSTGISFSPVPEAFYVGGWAGIFLLLPFIWLCLFFSVDYICGDLRHSPWGLFMVVIFAHYAPESLLGGLIYLTGLGNLALIISILFCTYVTPIIGALFSSNNRFAERASNALDISSVDVAPLAVRLLKNTNHWIP
jgi:hypothetical protein